MIIGIDASRANASKRTGTEWYSFHVINELKRTIPNVYKVILYSKEPLREDLADLPPHWESRVLRWPPQFLWTQLRLSWEMFFRKPDVLYVPAHTIPFIHPKKVVLVVHDVGFERQDELYDDKTIGYATPLAKKTMSAAVRIATFGRYSAREQDYHRFSMRVALKHATRIITVSEFSKKEMCELYDISNDRITVIYNGFNPTESASTPRSRKQQEATLARFHISRPYILFIGRIEQKKNIPALVEAFAVLKKKYGYTGRLVLAGSPGFKHEEVNARITALDLNMDIIQTGWVEEEELADLLHTAEAFVFPSLYEGFGIPIVEAMHAGLPVACSAIPPLEEVAHDAALYFDPHTPESIAQTLHTLVTQQTVRSSLVQKGKERATLFSWKETAKKTWYTIQQILHP